MKCYLINLDRSPERLAWFKQNSALANIEIQRVPAVDGDCLDPVDVSRLLKRKKSKYPMPAGAFGCFLSHRKVWEKVVERDEKWAFVAEDDAHIAKNAIDLFDNADWLPDNADIVKAETSREITEVSVMAGSVVGKFRLRRLKAAHRNTAAYFIARKSAAKLLSMTDQFCDPIDEVLFNPELGLFDKLTILQLDPAIAVQDKDAIASCGLPSTIVRKINQEPSKPMQFGYAKLGRELTRSYNKSIRPRILKMMRKSSFQRISYADD